MEVLFQAVSQESLGFKNFSALFNGITALLQANQNQLYIIDNDLVLSALNLLHRSYYQAIPTSSPTSLPTEEELELTSMRERLLAVLTNVGCHSEFVAKYGPLDSPLIATLLSWLPTPHEELQICSCVMLGNMAQSQSLRRIMVDRYGLHIIVFNVVKTSWHLSLRFSALGVLANLSLLPDVKEVLGDMGVISEMARFWNAPPSDQASVRVTWRVVKESINNVSRIVAPLLGGDEARGNNLEKVDGHTVNLMPSPGAAHDDSKTHLSLLLSIFDDSHSPELQLEVAHLVHGILWTVYNSGVAASPNSTKDLLLRIYRHHPSFAKPLGLMVQNGNPEIRSRGWFAMALMARTDEGAVALACLLADMGVSQALQATIRGQATSSYAQAPSAVTELRSEAETPTSDEAGLALNPEAEMMLAICKENALIMVHEILKHEVG